MTNNTLAEKSFAVLETVMASPARVDRDKGVIFGVKIIGLSSVNGNEYPITVLEQAIPLYEGAAVFINHPSAEEAEVRELYDHFGTLHNVYEEEDGLYGDLFYKKSHELADKIVDAAEKKPREFGLSHNAQIVTENGLAKGKVSQILRVRSVDLVSNPATTKGLFEENQMAKDKVNPVLEEETVDPVAASEPDPSEAVRGSFRSKIMKIIDDAGMDNAAKLEKISALLDAADQAIEAVSDSMPEDTKESADEGKLALEVRRLRIKDQARTILESEGIAPDPDLMDALSNMTSMTAMKKLVKSWPKKAVQKKTSVALEEVNPLLPSRVEAPKTMSVADFVKFARQ
jgi:hypothetical protein